MSMDYCLTEGGGVELGHMNSLPDLILELPVVWQYVIAGLVVIGSLWALWDKTFGRLRGWIMHSLWPSRENWGAECIPPESRTEPTNERVSPNRAWTGSPAERWTLMREMRKDDYYQLHIGKSRLISRIQVDTDEELRCPLKIKLQVKERDEQDWEDINGEYEYPINIDFKKKPRKLIALKFIISEPRLEPKNIYGQSPAWSIYDIRLTELRLFRRWWKKVIK